MLTYTQLYPVIGINHYNFKGVKMNLREYMKENHLSCDDVAAKVGYTTRTISGYLAGTQRVSKRFSLALEKKTKGQVCHHTTLKENALKTKRNEKSVNYPDDYRILHTEVVVSDALRNIE